MGVVSGASHDGLHVQDMVVMKAYWEGHGCLDSGRQCQERR